MNAKRLSLVMVILLAAGSGLWLARSTWRSDHSGRAPTNTGVAPKEPGDGPKVDPMPHGPQPGQTLRPPDPTRRFRDFTPEQRVEFARKGHGPGG